MRLGRTEVPLADLENYIVDAAVEWGANDDTAIALANDVVGAINRNGNGAGPGASVDLVNMELLNRIKALKMQPVSAVPTPWPTWNRVCLGAGGGEGLAHGWHIIVGAGSGSGKSLLATNLAARAIRAGEDVCMLSLEMSQPEVITRLLAIFAGEGARSLEHGKKFSEDAWEHASMRLQEAPGSIRVNSDPLSSLSEIEATVAKYAHEGCRTIIVDYLQLAWVQGADSMYDQITEVSHAIRGLARKLNVLTVGLSQVNRKTSFTADVPVKEGLLGGSSLENDADQVVLIGKPEKVGDNYRSEVVLDKNRHGPQTEWGMVLETDTLTMREEMPDERMTYER